ncbi:MAG: septal ring lytic transglycosylase RlpA family protein [Pseudomonadales bacterium]
MRQRDCWLVVLAVFLAACQTAPTPPSDARPAVAEPKDGPPSRVPPDLALLPDPVPRSEPKSARGNPSSYVVFGKTYRVMDTAVGYYSTGMASWYGTKFHGRLTSSGEPYDMYQLTAAHRSLPIPTYARVTNLDNGRSTVVRINDRGPFHSDRIIDLSFAAAVKLGFADQGTARVRVESLETGAASAMHTAHLDTVPFVLQAGAFRDIAAADTLKETLSALTGAPGYVVRVASDALYRVRLGPVTGRQEAQRLQALIVAADFDEPMILQE